MRDKDEGVGCSELQLLVAAIARWKQGMKKSNSRRRVRREREAGRRALRENRGSGVTGSTLRSAFTSILATLYHYIYSPSILLHLINPPVLLTPRRSSFRLKSPPTRLLESYRSAQSPSDELSIHPRSRRRYTLRWSGSQTFAEVRRIIDLSFAGLQRDQ